jgi:2-polyprenyl-3-methyl-5-hydroxy-6-metoxy-1,4-benzoquinol methylase
MKCKICGNEKENKVYEAREMMFGYRDVFRYFQCSKCNCLQIEELPQNISKYYPDNYYSFLTVSQKNKIKKILAVLKNKYALMGKGFIGKILYSKYPNDTLRLLRFLQIKEDTSIIDVGCGSGELLNSLYELGIKNILGVDPYNKEDIQYANGLIIRKMELHDVEGKWDIVMFHHSFEHIFDQVETLKTVTRLLTSNGHCVIRVPIVSSYAWKYYGINWVQLDAPRHFFLHSIESMKMLAGQAGLEVYKVAYDSTSFQFWGSEQYLKEIPLKDSRSYAVNPENSIFSKEEISAFDKRARELNKIGQGDQAVFYLRKF